MNTRKFIVLAMLVLCSALLVNAADIPAGAHVTVRLGSELSSGTAKTGQTWQGTVAKDVVVNGQTVAKAGDAPIYDRRSGKLLGEAGILGKSRLLLLLRVKTQRKLRKRGLSNHFATSR